MARDLNVSLPIRVLIIIIIVNNCNKGCRIIVSAFLISLKYILFSKLKDYVLINSTGILAKE